MMRKFRFWIKKEAFSIRELTVSRSRKVHLGMYESEDIFIAMKVDIAEHSALHEAYNYVSKYLEARIKTEETKLREKTNKR